MSFLGRCRSYAASNIIGWKDKLAASAAGDICRSALDASTPARHPRHGGMRSRRQISERVRATSIVTLRSWRRSASQSGNRRMYCPVEDRAGHWHCQSAREPTRRASCYGPRLSGYHRLHHAFHVRIKLAVTTLSSPVAVPGIASEQEYNYSSRFSLGLSCNTAVKNRSAGAFVNVPVIEQGGGAPYLGAEFAQSSQIQCPPDGLS
jgi:hypothetical protein